MKILIACEESQRVCIAFREKGHEAFSCDLMECSGGHPEWHIKHDVLDLLKTPTYFFTENGLYYTMLKWDMIIAFPPCTHLCVSGAAWFEQKRQDGRQRAGIEFFANFLNLDCEKVAIENPIGIISGNYIKKWFPELAEKYNFPIKPTQIIQPFQFGDPYTKQTCLWLKGLNPLKPTDILEKPKEGWRNQAFNRKDGKYGGFISSSKQSVLGSKTFPGVARAMAEQWG